MKKYRSIFQEAEEDKTQDSIDELITMKRLDTEEDKGKFLELIKGIVFSNNSKGNEFLNKINDFTSTLKKEDIE
jgi:hypothetical protein